MEKLTLADKVEQLHRDLAKTVMPRARPFGKELECFFDGIDLGEVLKPGSKVLELGCGYGNGLRAMQENFGIIPHGIDLFFYARLLDLFPTFLGLGKGIRYRLGSVESLPYEDGQFDFVFSYKSLIYVPDKLKAIKEAHRVLKLNGAAMLEIDAYTGKEFRYFPRAEEIIAASGDNQISVSDVEIWDGKLGFYAQPVHTATRAIITKKDNKALLFPELVDFRVARSWKGVIGVTSFYSQQTA